MMDDPQLLKIGMFANYDIVPSPVRSIIDMMRQLL